MTDCVHDDLVVAHRRLLECRARLARQIRRAAHRLEEIDARLAEIEQSRPAAPVPTHTNGNHAGGQSKRKLGPQQVTLAQRLYTAQDEHGNHRYTVAQIAAEFGVSPPTLHRYLSDGRSYRRRLGKR